MIRHLGRFYPSTPDTARKHVKDFTPTEFFKLKDDDGKDVLLGLKLRDLAKKYTPAKYNLFIGTPFRESVRPEYVQSIFNLQQVAGIDVQHEMTFSVKQMGQDLVRVRSRLLRLAWESEATHFLLVDGDNAFTPEVVQSMLWTGKDFVQAPYARRDNGAFSIRALPKARKKGLVALPEDIQPDQTVEIESTGLGLTLISRNCMEKMLGHYAGGDLDFLDQYEGQVFPTTALFMLTITPEGGLLSEDNSFAKRWRDMGGQVWLFIGEGTPIPHYGPALFQGAIENLGFTRSRPTNG
jgi:hypothetical protein